MKHFPITESVEEALTAAAQSPRDDRGYCYHTFRIKTGHWATVLGRLIDAGWQLQGGPHSIDADGGVPRHIVFSMLHVEPRPSAGSLPALA